MMAETENKSRRRMSPVLRVVLAVLMAFAVFLGSSVIAMSITSRVANPGAWFVGAMQHISTLLIVFLIFFTMGARNLQYFGLRKPHGEWLGPGIILGFSAGAVATLLETFIPGEGMEFVEDYTFWQQIVFIWILASTAEEFMFRGLIQSFLSPLEHVGLKILSLRLSLPVIVSAILFGCGHLALLTMGIPVPTVITVAVYATFVGLVAGYYRESTGSLVPAVVIHAAANMGGSVAGLLLGGGVPS